MYNIIYVIKYVGIAWFEKLKKGMQERGFVQLEVYPCVCYREDIVLIFYVDFFLTFINFKYKVDTL